jgi:hypothetical protein
MPSGKMTVQIYEELADREDSRDNPQMRDRFLILAADAALTAGTRDEAERLRSRLLTYNPHHLLRPYPSLIEAIKSPDVSSYIADLRHSYPPDEAFRLLEEMRAGQESLGTVPTPESESPREYEAPDQMETLTDRPAYPFPDPPKAAPELLPELPKPKLPKRPAPPEPPREEDSLSPRIAQEVYPYPAPSVVMQPRRPLREPDDEAPSALPFWVGNILFGVLLVASVGLLVWTFARPFLPL